MRALMGMGERLSMLVRLLGNTIQCDGDDELRKKVLLHNSTSSCTGMPAACLQAVGMARRQPLPVLVSSSILLIPTLHPMSYKQRYLVSSRHCQHGQTSSPLFFAHTNEILPARHPVIDTTRETEKPSIHAIGVRSQWGSPPSTAHSFIPLPVSFPLLRLSLSPSLSLSLFLSLCLPFVLVHPPPSSASLAALSLPLPSCDGCPPLVPRGPPLSIASVLFPSHLMFYRHAGS
ncbi:hypothetical protein J3F83DRAFT_748287 [Trichoderma novae-zelandiae]